MATRRPRRLSGRSTAAARSHSKSRSATPAFLAGCAGSVRRRGAEVSEVFHDAGGVFHHGGTEERVAGPAPDRNSYGSFASFSDPDAAAGFSRRSQSGCRAGERGGHGQGMRQPGPIAEVIAT